MRLNSLSIINYKNISEAELSFSTKINCFIGDNGMGKTNLLDAIYYLSFCKSHSNPIDSQNILHDADFFLLQGKYSVNDNPEDIYCGMKRKQKKQFKRNKKEYEKLSDHIGLLPFVLVLPDDSALISEGSEERRKFVDGVISQYNKQYLQHLLQYNNALKQRNALLKLETAIDDALLEIWEEQMLTYGLYIYEQRKVFIEEFTPVFQDIYTQISGGHEKISLKYQSQYENRDMKTASAIKYWVIPLREYIKMNWRCYSIPIQLKELVRRDKTKPILYLSNLLNLTFSNVLINFRHFFYLMIFLTNLMPSELKK